MSGPNITKSPTLTSSVLHSDGTTPLTWRSTQGILPKWSLGVVEEDDTIHSIKAVISPRQNKTWHWRTTSPNGVGFVDTQDAAKQAAENCLLAHSAT
jgi:hypothetical protein